MIGLLLACTAEGSGSSTDSAAPQSTSGESPYDAPALVAEYSSEDVDSALVDGTGRSLTDAADLHAWFERVMDDVQDKGGLCPARVPSPVEPDEWTSYFGGYCVGKTYTISGDWIAYVTRSNEGGEAVLHGVDLWSLTGSVNATGEDIYAGGHADILWKSTPTVAEFEMFYGGKYLDPLDLGPLSHGVSGGFELDGTVTKDAGFDATASGAIFGDNYALDFRTVVFTASVPVSGVIAVRDPSSAWWTVTLTGDGCGTLAFNEEEMGTTCEATGAGMAIESRLYASLADPP